MTLMYTGKDLLESANTGASSCHCHALCTRYTVYNGMHAYAAKMNGERHYINTQLTYTLEAISRITTINTSTDKTTKVVLLHVALE